jgi:hypothetical protein
MSDVTRQVPAGWYPDPTNGQQRWWDGQAWGAYAPQPAMLVRPATNGLAIASLILGLVAVLAGWIIFLVVVPVMIVGTILGFMGLAKANTIGGVGKGAAIVGIILNVGPFLLFGAFFVFSLFASAMN